MNDVKFLLALGHFYRLMVGLALGSMGLQGFRVGCRDEGLLRWVNDENLRAHDPSHLGTYQLKQVRVSLIATCSLPSQGACLI